MGTGPGKHQMAAKTLKKHQVSQVFRKIVQQPEFFDVPPSDVLDLSAEIESSIKSAYF